MASKRGCIAESLTEMPGRAGQAVLPALAPIAASRRVGVEIFVRVVGAAGAFAQHVVRVAKFAMTAGARQRFFDALTEHKVRADQPHGLADGGAQSRQPETPDDGIEDGLRRLARMNDARRYSERPGGGRHQQRRGLDLAVEPVAAGKLILDQPVGGGRVGDAQQCLRQHHQGQPLFGRQRIRVQKIFNPAKPAGLGADRLDQAARALVDVALGDLVALRVAQNVRRQMLVGWGKRCMEMRRLERNVIHRDPTGAIPPISAKLICFTYH
jgi:hypothetical protein